MRYQRKTLESDAIKSAGVWFNLLMNSVYLTQLEWVLCATMGDRNTTVDPTICHVQCHGSMCALPTQANTQYLCAHVRHRRFLLKTFNVIQTELQLSIAKVCLVFVSIDVAC